MININSKTIFQDICLKQEQQMKDSFVLIGIIEESEIDNLEEIEIKLISMENILKLKNLRIIGFDIHVDCLIPYINREDYNKEEQQE